jgi:hypothetical protein
MLKVIEILKSLAEGGVSVVPATRFQPLSVWCRDQCVATGDGRFCILSDVFVLLDEVIGEQGLPSSVMADVDVVLRSGLPGILQATTSGSGAQQASHLLEKLQLLKLHPHSWKERRL